MINYAFLCWRQVFLRESWRAQRAAKADVCAVLDLDRCRLSLLGGLEGLVSDILKYKREESNLVDFIQGI